MLKGGAIVPHAPLIALRGGPSAVALADSARAAWDEVLGWGCPVVLFSPHGRGTCVGSSGRGDLDSFGTRGIAVSAQIDTDLATRIAGAWDKPLLDGPLDHGAVGSLALAGDLPSLVTCSFAETTGPAAELDLQGIAVDASALATVVSDIAADVDLAVVASAHSAASLSERAPLTELPEGRAFDDALLDALATDNAAISDIGETMWSAGGTCSAGPLLTWAGLFPGRASALYAYDAPVGVGYLVASCS